MLTIDNQSSSGGHAPMGEPLRTTVTENRHALVRAFLIKYYGEGGQDSSCAEPLHTIPTKDRMGLVLVHGQLYAIEDIGLRMLSPRELFAAQGFPQSYAIERGADGRPLSKSAQVRMCGNSVCPPLAQALVRANYADPLMLREAA
jgi:DNA (cytosine-5)-methyltransferase 1